MSKFKKGDLVYLNKRGIIGMDYTLLEPILIKNRRYIIRDTSHNRVMLVGYLFAYDENLFKKFE